jgi:hypothetical protein
MIIRAFQQDGPGKDIAQSQVDTDGCDGIRQDLFHCCADYYLLHGVVVLIYASISLPARARSVVIFGLAGLLPMIEIE